MPGRNVTLSNLKSMSQLRNYLSKFIADKNLDNVLNQEVNQLLQKLQANSIYFWRIFEQPSDVVVKKPELPAKKEDVEPNETKEVAKITPKWKETRVTINKESVAAHTQHILTLLTTATTNQSILKRVEDLNTQLNTNPDAKHIAEKTNAVRLLLRIKQKTKNEEVEGAINEALALLGYAGPVKGKGIRVLSIDGGGIRGILVIEMLKKLEELTGKRVQEMFDLICGVSTGAIIASLVSGRRNLDEISEIYTGLSAKIFSQSALKGTSNLVWSHAYYDTALWEKLLQGELGDHALIRTARDPQSPKLCMLSAVIKQSSLSAYMFRNYTLSCQLHSKYEGSHKHKVWQAVRASAAAPTYFEEFKLGNMLHQDGGILFNNPTAVAIHEAKLIWPETPLQCVLSFGTGRTVPLPLDPELVKPISASSWKSKFYAVIESATDTEGVHTVLSDLLPDKIYYRFNPYLTEMIDMSEIDQNKLDQLKRDAVMYLRRNEDKFQEAAKVLNCERSVGQKVMDWVRLQKEIVGVKMLH